MDKNELNDLIREINEEVENRLDDSKDHLAVFTEVIAEYLIDAGEIEDAFCFNYNVKGVKLTGYNYGSSLERLDIFTSLYTKTFPPSSVSETKLKAELEKTLKFIDLSLTEGYFNNVQEHSPAFDLALLLNDSKDSITDINIYIFTDGRGASMSYESVVIDKVKISFHIWDIQRIHRLKTSGIGREIIEIDFENSFGECIPCLKIHDNNMEYTTCLAVFPGEVLAKLYSEHSDRLLERNVRAFLQARGKVNKGIRKTIATEPHMFLAYNNGICATAEAIEFKKEGDNGLLIKKLKDFQIVNGGQTTASLNYALYKDNYDLSQIYVQAKIAIIENPTHVNDVVPLISRYANSQNKVNEADFFANDPFHVKIEGFSRSIWAPAVEGNNNETKWFYERARGQYVNSKPSLRSAQRKFNAEYPSKQKFTKTDLSKYENTWSQFPHIVSLGAQKNFRDFAIRLGERKGFVPDEDYFRKLIAKAILFKNTEKIVSSHNILGYRANIVTYTIAWLSFLTAQRIDLHAIWKKQALSPCLTEVINDASRLVREHILDTANHRNVTEWCKKEECWNLLKEKQLSTLSKLDSELLAFGKNTKWNNTKTVDKGIDGADEADKQRIEALEKIGKDTWFQISSWAKETDNLESWQRGIAFSIGRQIANGRKISRKQALHGETILEKAKKLGFNAEQKI